MNMAQEILLLEFREMNSLRSVAPTINSLDNGLNGE